MIQRQQIEGELKKVLSDKLKLKPEQIRPDIRLIDDLGVDSLDLMFIAMEVEEKYHLRLPDTLLHSSPTLGEIVDIVCDILNKKETGFATDATAS